LVNATLAVVLDTSTTGLCPLTVTDSSMAPSFRVRSTRALKPTVSRSSSRIDVVKPVSSAFRR
jgi:hypothetical protein